MRAQPVLEHGFLDAHARALARVASPPIHDSHNQQQHGPTL